MRWLLLFLPMIALANGDSDSDETIIGGDITNDIKVDGMSKTVFESFAHAFGDVEIDDCIYTVQYFVFYQGARINPLCVADKLDLIGKHEEAAKMRCSIKRYRKPYGSKHQCTRVTMFVPPEPDEPKTEPVQSTPIEYVEQQQQIENLNAKFEQYDRDKRRAARKHAEDQAYKEELRQEIEERFPEK